MQIQKLIQGTPEWKSHRAKHFNASDAPAMFGVSPYKTRDELLLVMHRGYDDEADSRTQKVFDDGHRYEANARPLAAEIIGEELFSPTGTNGEYSASFDGLSMMEDVSWEHKTLNAELKEIMIEGCTGEDLPIMYRIQMEHQVIVCPTIEKILFTASKWDEQNNLIDIRHCWYMPNKDLQDRVIAAWKQFKIDLANYVAPEVKPEAVAEEVEFLPAIDIRAQGQISVIHNLEAFEQKLSVFLSEKLIRSPQSDNDFATLDLQIKAMKDAEEKLKLAGSSILAQIQAVDTAMSKKNSLQELVRQNRLMAEKLLASEKEARKAEAINSAKQAFVDHIATCNKALAETGTKVLMPEIAVDFIGAAKNKRTLDSLRSACNDELSRGKIEANRVLNHIDANLTLLREIGKDHKFLFADIQQLVLKDKDALEAIAKQRIAEHEAAEKKRIEAEAERIANERAEQERQQAATQPVLEQAVHADQDENLAAVAEYEQMSAVMPEHQTAQTVSNFATTRPAPNFDEPEAIADMSEFISGKHAAYKIALERFLECKKSGADFEQVLHSLIHSTQPVNKAA